MYPKHSSGGPTSVPEMWDRTTGHLAEQRGVFTVHLKSFFFFFFVVPCSFPPVLCRVSGDPWVLLIFSRVFGPFGRALCVLHA